MASRLRIFGRKRAQAEERALTRQTVPPSMLPATGELGPATAEQALRIADVYACVRALSDAAASLPLHVYRRRPDGSRQRAEGATAELLRRPAPATTQAGLIGQVVAHLTIWGNAYVGKFRDGQGRIDQLALLHPDRVTPELRAGRPIYTVTGTKGERSVHAPEDVLHVKALSTDGLVGLSPVRQCRLALGLSSSLTEHAARFFENDARPGGILKFEPTVSHSDADMRELADVWGGGHRGAENAHRVALMTGGVEWIPVSMPADDAQLLEQRKLSATEIARVFRVPPWIVGAEGGGSMTYSNVEQESLHFATYSLRPWLVAIEQALSADTDLFPGGAYCQFKLDALLRADSKTRAEVYTAALDPITGWLTRDEVRALEDLEPEREAPARPTPTTESTNGNGRAPVRA